MARLDPGVWGVLPTPFQESTLEVDAVAVRAVTDLYRSLGATGVVALGVFGEAAQLTAAERADVLRDVVAAAGDLGVVAGITHVDTDAACAEARMLAEVAPGGLTAVMVQVNSPDRDTLTGHLARVHDACGLPLVVQDYPVSSGVRVDAEVLAAVVADAPYAAAVKCESPPTSLAIARLAARVDVPLFGGLGGIGLLDELCAGAAGAMTGFSHPEALLATVGAWQDGGFDAARAAVTPWLPLINFEAQLGIGLAIRKEHFRRRGVLRSAAVRPPAIPLPTELLDHVEAHMNALAKVVN